MNNPPVISVIIPTFRRPEHLARALGALDAQDRKPDEVLVGVRAGDTATEEVLAEWENRLPVVIVGVNEPGVIQSMSAAAARSKGDIVCLLDDDAEPLPDWIERIIGRFAEDDMLFVLGGRDLLQDHPEFRARESTTENVGVFTWYGRLLGNHHRGAGECRPVDTIKGCNAAVRGNFLRENGFETRLLGSGAQVHWEVALCLDAKNAGGRVKYDPAIRVIHHVAPRHDGDLEHRGIFSPTGLGNMVWNEHFVIGTRAPCRLRVAHLAWSVFCGSRSAPGLLQYVRLMLQHAPDSTSRLLVTLRAMRDARRAVKLQRLRA